jgi:hypothetical protein
MTAQHLLPYVTTLGAFLVLVGFIALIWKEGVSKRVSTIAFFFFVSGIVLAVGSMYEEKNYDTLLVPASTTASETRSAEIATCTMAAKQAYFDALKQAGIACATDVKGWPNRDCVIKTVVGNKLYERLYRSENDCYRNKN